MDGEHRLGIVGAVTPGRRGRLPVVAVQNIGLDIADPHVLHCRPAEEPKPGGRDMENESYNTLEGCGGWGDTTRDAGELGALHCRTVFTM